VARAPDQRYPDASAARQAFDELVNNGAAALPAPRAVVVTPAPLPLAGEAIAATALAPPTLPTTPSRRLRRVAVAAFGLACSAALLFIPRPHLVTARRAGRAPVDRALAVAEWGGAAWAKAVLAERAPSSDDSGALAVRRTTLENLVESRFVPASLKTPALSELARMPPGSIASSVVRAVVLEKGFPRMRACYTEARRRDPALKSVRIVTAFSIERDGSVANPVASETNMPAGPLVDCVLASFAGLKFPPPRDVVTIHYPVNFDPD
jgi:hypothetical protein